MRSTKGRILCTEDDVDTRELIDFVLTQYGYEVVCSASNVQAIDLAKTQNFDLYLVDNWMPGLSGTELTEKLRQFDLKTPVLFYSGAASETDREAARVSGAQGYLVKPANGDQLIAEVTRLIAESKTTSVGSLRNGGGWWRADTQKQTGGNTIMKTQISIIKSIAIAMTLTALLVATSMQAAPQTEKSLYERLGGVFAIAAVVDHFSDAIVQNPIVGKNSKNPALRKWHTNNLDRLPGLKFMRTLWVCEVTGGPFKFSPTKPGKTHLGLEEAHRNLKISPEEFDEVAAELGRSLDFAKVPAREKAEVLAAFAAHKDEVTAGYKEK